MGYQFQQGFETASRGADANHMPNLAPQGLGYHCVWHFNFLISEKFYQL
jgi:hypothetical protein